MNEVAAAFRDMAAVLRQRAGQNVNKLAYVKGDWQLGRDKLQVNGTQWVARVDWAFHGWQKWWDGRVRDYRLGYVVDGFVPPQRAELGDLDTDAWSVWNNGRDPWQLGWSLPLYNQVSFEEVLWTTDTMGGRDCLAALMNAYADRLDSNPADGKILPIVELGTSSYPHPARGQIKIPVLDITGWAAPPNKPRPPLPVAEPQALPTPAVEPEQAIEGPHARLADFDDEVPF
jgi:hypothetical protein